jgi:hypothetical protein
VAIAGVVARRLGQLEADAAAEAASGENDIAHRSECGTVTGAAMLIAVTDHAAERFRQRVRGTLEEKAEVASRVARARDAGRVERGDRGTLLVRDIERPGLVFVCRPEHDELVVVTLWEEGDDAAVPKRFTDALRRDDHRT